MLFKESLNTLTGVQGAFSTHRSRAFGIYALGIVFIVASDQAECLHIAAYK